MKVVCKVFNFFLLFFYIFFNVCHLTMAHHLTPHRVLRNWKDYVDFFLKLKNCANSNPKLYIVYNFSLFLHLLFWLFNIYRTSTLTHLCAAGEFWRPSCEPRWWDQGVNVMKVRNSDGLSFAVPIDYVVKIVDRFKRNGYAL